MTRRPAKPQPSKPDPRRTPQDSDVDLVRELRTLGPRKPPKRVSPRQ